MRKKWRLSSAAANESNGKKEQESSQNWFKRKVECLAHIPLRCSVAHLTSCNSTHRHTLTHTMKNKKKKNRIKRTESIHTSSGALMNAQNVNVDHRHPAAMRPKLHAAHEQATNWNLWQQITRHIHCCAANMHSTTISEFVNRLLDNGVRLTAPSAIRTRPILCLLRWSVVVCSLFGIAPMHRTVAANVLATWTHTHHTHRIEYYLARGEKRNIYDSYLDASS